MSPYFGRLIYLILICGAYFTGVYSQQADLSDAQEYAAYRDCLAHASQVGCHMNPDDFVRFYALKDKLEAK